MTQLSKEESRCVVTRCKPYKLFPHGFKLLTALETRFLKILRYLKKLHFGEPTSGQPTSLCKQKPASVNINSNSLIS